MVKIFIKIDPNVTNNTSSQSNNKSNITISYSLDENSPEKINWLFYLATPRILFIVVRNNQTIPFIFKLLPSMLCHSHMIEHYILQWCDIQSITPVYLF